MKAFFSRSQSLACLHRSAHARLLLLVALLYFVACSSAKSLFVSPLGAGSNCSAPAPCSFATAVSYLSPNDQILLSSGEYAFQEETKIRVDAILTPLSGVDSVIFTSIPFAGFILSISARVNISGIYFVGCDGCSGAITTLDDGILSVSNCTFSGFVSPIHGDGAAIFINTPEAHFERSRFISNKATGYIVSGGAVAIRSPCKSNSAFTFSDCVFVDNSILGQFISSENTLQISGGAISFVQECNVDVPGVITHFELSDSSFSNNRVEVARGSSVGVVKKTVRGGALSFISLNRKTIVSISNSTFDNNQASQTDGLHGVDAEGGAVFARFSNDLSQLSVINSSFVYNIVQGGNLESQSRAYGAYAAGGAISFSGSGTVELLESNFTNNMATAGAGGGLRGDSDGGAVACEFLAVPGVFGESDIISLLGSIKIDASIFSNNAAQTTSAPNPLAYAKSSGGAVSVSFSDRISAANVEIVDSSFSSNVATAATGDAALGGAVSVLWVGRIETVGTLVSSSYFWRNIATGNANGYVTAPARGGAIALSLKSSQLVDAPQFYNTTFINNEASGSDCRKKEENCSPGSAQGGAVSVHRDGEVFFSNPKLAGLFDQCKFEGNKVYGGQKYQSTEAFVDGGAIVWELMQEPFVVQGSSFDKNVVSCILGSGFVEDKRIIYETKCRGGAVVADDGIEIRSSNFSGNCIIGLNSGTPPPDNGVVAKTGGAVSASSFLTISDSNFADNHASGLSVEGGTIYAASADVEIIGSTFTNSTVTTPSPSSSGGIASFYICKLAVKNSTFSFSSIRNGFKRLYEGNGGAIALHGGGRIDSSRFIGNTASFGGSIWAHLIDNNALLLSSSIIANSTAANGGGGVYFANVPEHLIDKIIAVANQTERRGWHGNAARYGNAFSSSVLNLTLASPPPTSLFPGQKFSLQFAFRDIFNQIVIDPLLLLELVYNHDSPFEWVPVRSSTPLFSSAASGVIEFPEIEIITPPRTNFRFSILHHPKMRVPIKIMECPPGYILHESKEEFFCSRCPIGLFNVNGSSDCEPCESSEVTGAASFCLQEPSDDFFEETKEQQDPQLAWIIPKGYFPVPFVRPSLIVPCANPEACLQYNCSMAVSEDGSWRMDCGHCSHEAQHENKDDCHCEPGYQGRLCSDCVCNSAECYFSYGTEEHLCTICRPQSSPILIGAVVFLQVSMIAFLVFHRSAASLFLAEAVLAVILILLGIGEWYIFNFVSMLALMFLLTSAEKRHSHGNPHDSHAEIAQRIGVIKIILFFVQTTPAVVSRLVWPDWVRLVVERLSALNLKISGLECLNPTIFSSPVGRFSFTLSLPVLLSFSLTVSVVLATLFRWANLKNKLKHAIQRCRSKKTIKDELDDDSSEASSSVASDSEVGGDEEPQVPLLSNDPVDDDIHDAVNTEPTRPSFRNEVLERMQYAILFVLFSGYFELSNAILYLLRPCVNGYMAAYPFVPCSFQDTSYLTLYILAWVGLAIYVVGVPVLFAVLLFRNRDAIKAGSHVADRRIGFLYESFRREVFWFEMIWMARRIAISVTISFIARSSLRTALLAALFMLSLFLGRFFHPFTTSLVNNLEITAISILFYTYIVGETIASSVSQSESHHDTSILVVVIQTILCVLNVGFVVTSVGVLVKDTLKRWVAWLRRRSCCCCCE